MCARMGTMWGNGCGNTFGLHGWAIFFADLFATIGARQDALHFMFVRPKEKDRAP